MLKYLNISVLIRLILQNRIIILGILFIIEFNVQGQIKERFERLSRIDGLSHDNVYSILQDKYGFMWFGTQNG